MGVRIRAVASLERIIEIRAPSRKTFKYSSEALFFAKRAACAASQSNRPASSANAERPIMPRKKRKVFHWESRVARASSGAISPRMSSKAAPASATSASFHWNGRSIMPTSVRIAMSEVRSVLVRTGRWKKSSIKLIHPSWLTSSLIWQEHVQRVIDRDHAFEHAGGINHRHGEQVILGHDLRDLARLGVGLHRDHVGIHQFAQRLFGRGGQQVPERNHAQQGLLVLGFVGHAIDISGPDILLNAGAHGLQGFASGTGVIESDII